MKKMHGLYMLLLTLILVGPAFAQSTVKVTFLVNSATVPDTLWPDKAVIQMRGDTAPLTWDGSTGVTLTNVGGDYWTATVDFPVNAKVQYKFFTNAASASGDQEHKGWENDILPDGNRILQTGTADMIVPLQFINGSKDKQDQFWKPWSVGADSIAVWVRVNMQGWEAFNPATDRVGVRGAAWPGYLGNLSWAHTLFLNREDQHGNGGSRNYNADFFYSGVVKIPRDSVAAAQEIGYKFVIMSGNDPDADPKKWEDGNDHKFLIPSTKADTTLAWAWFNNTRPAPFVGSDTLTITYNVDLTKAIQNRGFKTGDTVIVQSGWNGTGRDLTDKSPTRTILTKQGFTNTYTATETVIAKMGSPLYYQYYVVKDGQDVRETFYNFDYTGSDNSLAERRVLSPSEKTFTVSDNLDSRTDMHRMPVFRNTSVLARQVKVTWTCDVRPAIFQTLKGDTLFDIQGTDHITDPATILTKGLWMNGPATSGWTTWGLTLRDDQPKKMWDDGTHGDAVANDSIFTVQFLYAPDSTGSRRYVGQEFKFGIFGGDNEGGRGGFGNNHYENIDDSQTEVTIHSQFGSINPSYYSAWDFNKMMPKPGTVNVTFMVNTATVPDTLWPDKAVIQLRGDTAPLTWDGATGVNLTNIGGDYWTATVPFPANTRIQYKVFTNASSASGDQEHKGWENDIDPNGNRELTTGSADIVVPVQFANGSASRQLADWKPWTIGSDSIAVWVRVNMQGWEAFNPATDRVGVRGAAWPGYLGNLSWAHTLFLTKEAPHGNGGSRNYNADFFYSGVVKIPRDSVAEGQEIGYKFVIMGGSDPDADPKKWEDGNDHKFTIPVGKKDTTLFWGWFNGQRPQPFVGSDTLTINYKVDLTKAIQNRGFKTGDTLIVQTGWNGSGRDLTDKSPTRTILTKQGFTNTYVGTETIIAKMGNPLYYQYYLVKDGQDIRETFYNFYYTGSDNSLAERRIITPADKLINVEDIVDSRTSMNRMPVFRNTSVLARAVKVFWEVDMRPAWYQVEKGDTLFDIQGTDHVFKTGTVNPVYTNGVWMNGPATGGWTTWGQTLRDDAPKKMWDDGSNGDLTANDNIYTVTFLYAPDSTGSKRYVGQEFKFGSKGGDNEGGRGGFGNNHYENIDDTQAEVRIRSQFGSINPGYYTTWDYNNSKPVSVEQISTVPTNYRLEQNYPNPFNPSTTIGYSLLKSGHVTLKVYDMFGREMATLVDARATSGEYRVTFDARTLGSGMYLYELSVDGFRQTRTMTLVK